MENKVSPADTFILCRCAVGSCICRLGSFAILAEQLVAVPAGLFLMWCSFYYRRCGFLEKEDR